jgi:ABC-type sugar transport system permease subunit
MQNLFDLESEPLMFKSNKYALGSVLAYIIWTGLAGNMVIYCGTMTRVPEEILESGRLDGLGFYGELFHIVLPLIWPTMSVILLLAVVGIFNADGPILLMTQGRFGTMTIGYWIYKQTVDTSAGIINYGAAVGLTFTLFSIPLSLLCRWIISRIDSSVEY